MRNSIFVVHNAEIAHRLMNLPGKCQQIHGHSLEIEVEIRGELDENGILEGIDFGKLKKAFREYIDSHFDHRLLLNENDPWANEIGWYKPGALIIEGPHKLPGLQTFPGDPTTENIAKWIVSFMAEIAFMYSGKHLPVTVVVRETGTNGATARYNEG